MLDLHDTLPPEARDDKLALVYQVNSENFVSVNTSVGQTERVNMKNIVMQGGKWGPLQCSNSMDKIGKKCVELGENLYTYKGLVKIMPLAMVDDLLTMAKCGIKSTDLNITINKEIEFKKLKLHTPNAQGKSKCHTLHIGKNDRKCQELKVHGYPMEKVNSDTYLGDIISRDGKNKLNIENRAAKGVGIVSQIMDTLKTVSFGEHYFMMAAALRESMLVNGILTNCDVWYGLTDIDVGHLEEVDRLLLRQVFGVASSCPIEALYLELGCLPISVIIKSRRINFLHYLATRKPTERLYKFFITQWNHPAARNEWTEKVKLDLEEFGISDDLDLVKGTSEYKFKKMVRKKAREVALENLTEVKSKHSKMDNVFYVDLKMQEYLKDKNIRRSMARALFKFKTRMARFSENFKEGGQTKPCPLCKDALDTQRHSLECKVIVVNLKIDIRYEDLFHSKIDKKVAITAENILKFKDDYLEV